MKDDFEQSTNKVSMPMEERLEKDLLISRIEYCALWHALLYAFSKKGALDLRADKDPGQSSRPDTTYVFENNYPTGMDTVHYLFSSDMIVPDKDLSDAGQITFTLTDYGREALDWLDDKYGPSLLELYWDEPDQFRDTLGNIVLEEHYKNQKSNIIPFPGKLI